MTDGKQQIDNSPMLMASWLLQKQLDELHKKLKLTPQSNLIQQPDLPNIGYEYNKIAFLPIDTITPCSMIRYEIPRFDYNLEKITKKPT